MNRIKLFATALLILFETAPSLAQNIKVSGRVTDSNGSVQPGVLVYVKKDPGKGTATDKEGRYSISAPENAVLVYSLLGFKEAEIPVEKRSVINVALEIDAAVLDDVVIIGYGSQKKEFVVGSVSQVTSKEILKAPTSNVQNMLTGRLAGMSSVQNYGTPGFDQTIMLIRGVSTFTNSSPLCIVDGAERPLSYLNPNDVASISILKDAATASIYGVKGANGVILVTTKSGRSGKASISYDMSATLSRNTATPKMLNAKDYIYWHNRARELDGQAPYWTEENLEKMRKMGVLGDTDWPNLIYKNFGTMHQHNISASGGSEKSRYYISLGYMNQEGILRNTGFDRYNIRVNIDSKIASHLNFMINVAGDHSNRTLPGYEGAATKQSEFSPISQAYYALPLLKQELDGKPLGFFNGVYTYTPLAALTMSGYNDQTRWNMQGSSKLDFDFDWSETLKGLKISIFCGLNYTNTLDKNFMTKFDVIGFDPRNMSVSQSVSLGISKDTFTKSASMGWNLTLRPQLDYTRIFGKHNLTFLALFESYKGYSDTMTGYKAGYFAHYPVDLSLGMENLSPFVSGGFTRPKMASFASRINYSYSDKYLLELTMRADGSYKFAPKNRWGYFPSIALGWVVSKENFFKVPWINFFKIRASFGMLGNDDVPAFLYKQTFLSTSPNPSIVIGEIAYPSFYTTSYVHKNLTWSNTNTYNFGFDARLLNEKLTIGFDWFYKYTNRILENISYSAIYSPSLGGNNPLWENNGAMDNRGFEFTIRHDNWFANGWNYSISGILSWARNKLLRRHISDNHPSYRAVLGQPIGSIYGFHALGLFQTQEEVENYPTAPSGWADLGEIKYQDINGDGRIESTQDYVKIGRSRNPEMTFSLNGEVSYKNLSLSILLQGVTLCNYQLNGVYDNTHTDNTMFTRPFYAEGNAAYYLVENSWTPENTNAKYPRLRANANANNAWSSDWWIKDGSYLRLKNLQLSYTFPKKISGAINLSRLSTYIAGTNLFTISDFKYMDPENPGINNGYYPQQRTYSLGINITF